jgi:hypothetical protein
MAAQKSAKYPHKWPDGTWHSIPWSETKRAKETGTPNPPPGSYDPALDSALGQAERGLRDITADIGEGGTQRVRAENDLATALAQLQQRRDRSTQDYQTGTGNIETGYQRSLSDLLQARQRGEQDYGSNISTLQRNFANLGIAQGEGQRKAGAMIGSGAAQQAARKRAANEAIERAPIDTAYQRFMADSNTTQGRLGEDKQRSLADLLTAYTRGDQDLTAQSLQLNQGFGRQGEDWATQLLRAQREAGAFADDTLEAKVAQFVQNNPGQQVPFIPGAMPIKPQPVGETLTAGPGVPGTTVRKRKTKNGQIVTYTNSVKGP